MIIHGLQHKTLGVKLDVWIHNVASLVAKLRALLTGETSPDPLLIKHCSECVFEACCRKQVVEKDDLSLIDGLGKTERVKLNAKGIFTVTQLAYTFRPRRRPKHVAAHREKYHHALKALAIRERKIHVVGKSGFCFGHFTCGHGSPRRWHAWALANLRPKLPDRSCNSYF